MENIWIFVATVFVYSLIWFAAVEKTWKFHYIFLKHWAKRVAVVALLVLPLNIDGNVFTIAGTATAEKSVYSLFSVYQNAGQNAVTFIGLAGYQQAGRDAVTVIGLAGYQQAGQNTGTLVGFVGYQKAVRDAITIIGLAGYQQAGQNAVTGTGLAGYQQAKNSAVAGAGITLYQRVGEKTRAFVAFSKLTKD